MAQVNDGLTYGLDQFKFGEKVLGLSLIHI